MTDTYTIAVVDDDIGTTEVLRRFFLHHGFQVVVAGDGEEGLQAGLDENTDLVILDVMMPGLDGYEVAATLRKERPLLPIIMLTARVEPHDRMRGLMTGAHRYITKPCSPVKILEEAHRLLGLPMPKPRSASQSGEETADFDNPAETRFD